jgi:hypothetical protein
MRRNSPLPLAAVVGLLIGLFLQAWVYAGEPSSARGNARGDALSDGRAADPQDATVTVPRTPYDVLRNIKLALDSGLLARDDFFDDENLKRVFGGTGVHRMPARGANADPRDLTVEITGLEHIAAPERMGTLKLSGLRVTARRTFGNDQRTRVSASLVFRLPSSDRQLNFDRVTSLFGPGWTNSSRRISPHEVIPPPTALNGSRQIQYVRENASITLSFGPDATLAVAHCSITMETK